MHHPPQYTKHYAADADLFLRVVAEISAMTTAAVVAVVTAVAVVVVVVVMIASHLAMLAVSYQQLY